MKNYRCYRCIYRIDAITLDGDLVVCRYARNKRIAERIAKHIMKRYDQDLVEVSCYKLCMDAHFWVDPDWVEG